ncbi:MAG: peptidoglycan DD-metalloendopeptidase family protein [Chitinophagaceae bacterium]|nr:peptidoglycan DD-metalloendopeptidase family protein [Chitinophagaceae bacterium]
MVKECLFFFFIALPLMNPVFSQSADKAKLEQERKEIQKELQEIQNIYNKIKGQSKQTLGQLNVLNRKIQLQEQYLNNINREIHSIDDEIYLTNLEIYRLQNQLDTLKAEYARSVVYAYKNRSNYDYLNFIFSANSFNDFIRRISYLKNYRAYRQKQIQNILETRDLIEKRKELQLKKRQEKNQVLEKQTKEVEELEKQKKEKAAVMARLKAMEKDLSQQIAAKKKRDRMLQNAINAIIRREIEAARAKAKAEAEAGRKAEEERRKAEANKAASNTEAGNATTTENAEEKTTKRSGLEKKPDSYLNLNARDVELNNSFAANRSRLPWPVDNGIVTLRYGFNKIENTLLTFDNPGITIATPAPGVPVKAVFDGEVVAVYSLGDGSVVTLRHGKYFTTYSNLSSVMVSKGMTVKTGQQIGKAGRDDEGTGGQIDFILMIETRNVDPLPWLRR